MFRRTASLAAAIAAAAVISCGAFATNGGVVGNVVDAGENIINDVVDAGESVVDDVTDAVTGNNDRPNGGNTGTSRPDGTTGPNGTTGGTTGSNGTTGGTTGSNGTTGGTTGSNGTTGVPDEVPNGDDTGSNDNQMNGAITGGGQNTETTNPDTGISFPFAAVSALALGGAGIAYSMRRKQ